MSVCGVETAGGHDEDLSDTKLRPVHDVVVFKVR